MPRKPIKKDPEMPTRFGIRINPADDSQTVKVEKTSWWQQIRTFCLDPRTRVISGVVLLAIAFLFFIAYISFFFTGTADQSLVDMSRAERREHRGEIRNILGLPGAALADFLIDGSFGLVSIVLILLMVVYGLYFLKLRFESPLRAFVCTVFWLLWGAIAFGFLQLMIGSGTFRWGGAFGAAFSRWLNSYIQPVGMIIVLLVTLLIFFVLADKQFIYRCRRLVVRIKQFFRRKPKAAEPTEVTIEEPLNNPTESVEGLDPIIDISVKETHDSDTLDGSITFTIDAPAADLSDVSDNSENSDNSDNAENSEDSAPSTPDEEVEIADTKPVELAEDNSPEAILAKLGPYDPRKDLEYFKFPALDLLKVYDNETMPVIDQDEQRANGTRIVTTLRNYGIEIESIKATVGPTVTLYEIVPKAGVRVAKIQNLENDIMLSLSATGIRIIAPMPGKGTVGIEVPNEKPQVVSMHSVIASKRFQDEQKMRLPVAIGRTITNEVFMFDLAKTPHLLIAGATGQGKSVAINAILTSLLYKKHPAELKMVLVDPKMVEFTPYKALCRHYLAAMPDV